MRQLFITRVSDPVLHVGNFFCLGHFLIAILLKGPLFFINALTKLASSNFQCIEEEGYWTDGLLPKAFQVIFTCVCACRACIHIYTHRIDNVLAPQLSKSGLSRPCEFFLWAWQNIKLSLLKMHILHLAVLFRIFRNANLDMLQLLHTWVHVSMVICPHIYAWMCAHVHMEFRNKHWVS